MTKRSNYIASFNIAGMKYWDGALVLSQLKPGKKLKLKAEPNNPADANAVALYYKKTKLGFIPHTENALPAMLLRCGHKDVIEARILKVDKQADTWKQVTVGLYMTDRSGK